MAFKIVDRTDLAQIVKTNQNTYAVQVPWQHGIACIAIKDTLIEARAVIGKSADGKVIGNPITHKLISDFLYQNSIAGWGAYMDGDYHNG